MDMKHVKYLALVLCIGNLSPVMAQTASKSLTVDNLVAWQRISGQAISDNGKWVACKMEPWEGDAVVNLYDAQGKELATFPRADRFLFSASSDYLVVSQKPGKMIVDSLKIKKTKKEKMPMDALVIYSLSGGREVIDSLKTFRLAEKADWVAFQKGRKDSTLYVQPLNANLSTRYEAPAVKAFNFAEKSGMLYYITAGDKAEEKPGLYLLNTETGVKTLIKEGDGVFKQVTFDEDGANLAFLYCAQKDSCYKAMSLWLSQQGAPATEVAARGNRAFPKGWVISEHGKLQFSKSASRLFFGTSPEPRQKDTLQLAENRPNVQVWSCLVHVQDGIKNIEVRVAILETFHVLFQAISHKLKVLSAVSRIFHLANLHNVLIKALTFVGGSADSVAGFYPKEILVIASLNLAVVTLLFGIITLGGFSKKLIVCFAYRLTHEGDVLRSTERINIVRHELPVIVSQRPLSLTE